MDNAKMQAIPVEEILRRDTLPVDLFVCLADSKFVVIAKAGSDTVALHKFRERKLQQFFVRVVDYFHLVQLAVGDAQAKATGTEPVAEKMNTLCKSMGLVYTEVESIGFDETTFGHTKLTNHATLTFLAKNPRCMEHIPQAAGDESAVNHAMMVSVTSAMLGVALGWTKPATLEKLALGGFLHDIGKVRIPAEVNALDPSELNEADRVIYQSHPEVGWQMLLQVKSVPDDIALIVREHHELADGTGFPRGVRDLVMSPLAKVVSLANEFVDTLHEAETARLANPAEILRDWLKFRSQCFNRDAVAALCKLFPRAEADGKKSA